MAIMASEVATGCPLMARMVSPAARPARSAGPALRTAEATTLPSRFARRSPSQPLGGCGAVGAAGTVVGAFAPVGVLVGGTAPVGWRGSAAAAGAAAKRIAASASRAERGIERGMLDELW